MHFAGFFAEALALGVSSGPACLASCGPVLVPILTAERRTARGTGITLAGFLSGRLAGYLLFASAVYIAGHSLEVAPRARGLVFGFADLAMAVLLAAYARELGRTPKDACRGVCAAGRFRVLAGATPALLGLVSGISLCPPFLAAGVRATQGPGLVAALVFFACFFLGTSVWFLPSLGLGLLRRWAEVAAVARLVLFVLAGYYAYLAFIVLGGFLHG
ncbi:MAG: sulfite exporter TauE/SafE family protein [Acidobacteriales bacterium]|nr:sulfite exporter TauE/SafE family protein [Terriglobales bacterium]